MNEDRNCEFEKFLNTASLVEHINELVRKQSKIIKDTIELGGDESAVFAMAKRDAYLEILDYIKSI